MARSKQKAQILVHGNPIDGFEFLGPFDNLEESIQYGERLSGDWWTADLEKPEWKEK